jgi:butyryl-CoA dehydrogenase
MAVTAAPSESTVRHDVLAWVDEAWDPELSVLEWRTRLVDAGWAGATWSPEWGGRGLSAAMGAVASDALAAAGVPGPLDSVGMLLAVPTLLDHGSDELKRRLLRPTATGEVVWCQLFSEPGAGSDLAGLATRAVRDGDEWVITGQKMWATNGLRAGMMTMLAVTDPDAEPRHRGLTAFVLEKEPGAAQQPGLTISAPLKKLGYKGVESVEMSFDGFLAPADAVLGGEAGIGQGFKYFMGGIELGRCNIAARAVGIAMRAFEESIRYAQEREAFGKPIAQHQAIQLKLAQMATKIEASRLLLLQAVEKKDAGERADLEAGMAKWFATETAEEVALEAMRIHGGAGYSQELVVERIYRDAPVLILGEGSNEIQQLVIARRLLERHAIR